nr:hypothetical protein [Pseudomonadota bacterium]
MVRRPAIHQHGSVEKLPEWRVALAAFEVAALGLALLFGAPAWASIGAAGGAVAATLLQPSGLLREWRRSFPLIAVVALVCGFAAIGVRTTFEKDTHVYEVLTDIEVKQVPELRSDQNVPNLNDRYLEAGEQISVLCL